MTDSLTAREELQALVRAIQRTQGFGLFFAICESAQTATIVQYLQQALSYSEVSLLELVPMQQDRRLVNAVKRQLATHPNSEILLVAGLENWLSSAYEKSQNHPVLNHLNQQREWFRAQLLSRLVFILSPEGLTQVIKQAPDFFDWRSGVFHMDGILD